MIATFQALLVALIAVLPGVVYTIARESHGATWAFRQTDPAALIFRFLSASAVFHALFAPATYHAYQKLIVTHALTDGNTISWWWWGWLLAYLFVPFTVGIVTERVRRWEDDTCPVKKGISRLVALYAGRYPELRAWDWFFSKRLTGIVRLQLTNDEWKAGLWADSFASGYGEDSDLYIAGDYLVDADGILQMNEDGQPISGGAGLLIRWSEIRYLEFAEWKAVDETANDDNGSGHG